LESDDCVLVPGEHFEGEVDADGGPVVLREELVHVALDDGRFARAQLSDHQDLVQVLATLAILRLQESGK
jgi:hypothetical protein